MSMALHIYLADGFQALWNASSTTAKNSRLGNTISSKYHLCYKCKTQNNRNVLGECRFMYAGLAISNTEVAPNSASR
jgi:hypothetical protein